MACYPLSSVTPRPIYLFFCCLFSLTFFLRPSLSLMSACKPWLGLICMLCISCRVSHLPGVCGCRKQRTSVEPGKPLGGPPRRNIVGCRIQHIWKEGSMFSTQQQPPKLSAITTTTIWSMIILTWVLLKMCFCLCIMCLTDLMTELSMVEGNVLSYLTWGEGGVQLLKCIFQQCWNVHHILTDYWR